MGGLTMNKVYTIEFDEPIEVHAGEVLKVDWSVDTDGNVILNSVDLINDEGCS
jgi:hypothetical protein